MQKRILAPTLALLLALTLFAACDGGDSAPDGDSGGGDSAQSTAQVGDVIEFGGYDWRVLDIQDGKALILSDGIPEYGNYHATWEDITWEHSYIRQYLNGEFYDSFTADEKAQIAETRVTNDDNPWYGTPGGNDTTDRIFLLSIEEVMQYFGNSGQLASADRAYDYGYIDDEYNEARIVCDTDGTAVWWWFRSPGRYSTDAAGAGSDGSLYVDGSHVYHAGISGVRPAMWLEL